MTASTTPRARAVHRVAPLLFCSGACALVYQVAWQREFRLVFGASTAASAAVIAIFIAGLGAGGFWLGRRADRKQRPLELYSQLELGVAALAGATIVLLPLVRAIYIKIGGSFVMGMSVATVVRLLFATLVLAGPTFLMGGTLPAAARAVERDADAGRRDVALLYGVNTLGAVTGALFATFFSLEVFGNRMTLILACLVNALVAVVARAVARSLPAVAETSEEVSTDQETPAEKPIDPITRRFAFVSSLVVGFAFFLMEIVWYRLLGPLLGGTVFTFGLVLAVALLGIGIGGALYGLLGDKKPASLSAFATTSLLEAICVTIPFAWGDSLALLALRLQPLAGFGFAGQLAGWGAVAALVILPASIASGYQFPLLIGLVGRGRAHVGEEIGRVYAWNTVGAIGGAVAGGFGLLPLLSAPGCWRLVAILLALLGVVALALAIRERLSWVGLVVPAACACLMVPLLRAEGPTAVWRHSSIGAGRADLGAVSTPNSMLQWSRRFKRDIVWSRDGVESGVGIDGRNGYSFIVNGKNDGNARSDGATQVMCGLLSTMLNPGAKKGLVIGLGTGSTAGWMGAAPQMERVDVLELEPLVLEMARRSAPVNRDALANPKVRVLIGDGREAMLTLPDRYDVIASEPSNPYRAGIASLYTREFYESARDRLSDDGVFAQWLQAYEVDAQTVRTVIATIATVFPHVEVWELKANDILLQASKKPIVYDVSKLRQRITEEPFRSALRDAWRVHDLEGVFAHHIARPTLAQAIRASEGDALNTDDATIIEFAFARSLASTLDIATDMRNVSRQRGEYTPALIGDIDAERLEDERAAFAIYNGNSPANEADLPKGVQQRNRARKSARDRSYATALREWKLQESEPRGLIDLTMMAEAAAETGSPEAQKWIEQLAAVTPLDATCLEASLAIKNKDYPTANAKLLQFIQGLRQNPWPDLQLTVMCISEARLLAAQGKAEANQWFEEIANGRFAVSIHETQRADVVRELAAAAGFREHCQRAFAITEPYVDWSLDVLRGRAACYAGTGDPLLARAEADLRLYLSNESRRLSQGLEPTK